MEQKNQTQNESTKVNTNSSCPATPLFSQIDEREFRAYQRNKRINEAKRAIAKTQASVSASEDVQSVCQRAVRLRQAAVRLPLSKLSAARYYLNGTSVALDCAVGGDGETLAKVKAYETKLAVRCHADEITVPIAPSLLDACRFGEIQKELIKIKRAARKAKMKVRVEKTTSPTTLSRVARIASDAGARYFSVPYYEGCERLRVHLAGGCDLEVTGVDDVSSFKKLIHAGVERIDTRRGLETYTQLLQEIQEMQNEPPRYETKEKTPQPCPQTNAPADRAAEKKKDEETDYFCRIENGKLTFL